jgi:RNA polymerase sigma-70 factor (ECF subfamily)
LPDPWRGQDVDDDLELALGQLTPNEQVVLALRYGKDMTVPMIAEATGLPEGTVKSRLHNALRHLRAAIDAQRRG